ncbi:hypothetical protein ACQ4LE_007726 [Meloidogyne hapla]
MLVLITTFIVSADNKHINILRWKRYTYWGDVGARLSPFNSVASNHRVHPYYNGGGGFSNFMSGFGK